MDTIIFKNHIDPLIKEVEVYRSLCVPRVSRRNETWNLICQLSKHSIRPRLCVENFNEILHQHEKEGKAPRAQWQIADLWRCLNESGLQDMDYQGESFTWCNGREALNTIRAHLDGACCCTKWANLYLNAQVHHENRASSDHSAIWVDLNPQTGTEVRGKKKRFHFEAMWTHTKDCSKIIKQAWVSDRLVGKQESFIK
ncbi:UNVERIFIED_CONTAM: hypothetical protein Sradi_3256700 [Sesamum radiatum]|uniref:Uncharacterized protein n=1 Tax=Sesamum radiatum TaxID=300843 RepID=A0AAW2QZS3_SESRA